MDPLYTNNELARARLSSLPTLNDIEEMFIAIYNPVMKIYRLKNGQWGFEGNVVNLPQDIGAACSVLPRLPSDVSIFFARRKTGEEPSDFKDFKIRKTYILRWLQFLKHYNPYYNHITISNDNLSLITNPDGTAHVSAMDILHDHILNPAQLQGISANNSSDSTIPDISNVNDPSQGGIEAGAVPIEPEIENILETAFLNVNPLNGTEANFIDNAVNPTNTIDWPSLGPDLLGEYTTPGLLCKSFPCLFPFGNGDPFDHNRRYTVSLHDTVQHLQRYAINIKSTNPDSTRTYYYPFARHPRFCHYVQNMDERHRIYTQANFCIKDSELSMTRQDLENIQRDPTRLQELKGKITRYGANITGSPPYFYQRRKELENTIDQKGAPTVWWTLSFPDFHWDDLHKLFGERGPNMTDEDFRKWKAQNLKENPGLVNEFFVKRVEAFVGEMFGRDVLDAEWHWYRFEWQKRLSIHVHGLAKLKSDPGLTTLGIKVYQGRKSARILRAFNSLQEINITQDPAPVEGDTYLQSFKDLKNTLHTNPLSNSDILDLQRKVEDGIQSENIIVAYRDYILSSMNPITPLPLDATLESRDEAIVTSVLHPCSICHLCGDNSFGFNPLMLSPLLNECNRLVVI